MMALKPKWTVNANIWLGFILTLWKMELCSGLPRDIRIGGLFENGYEDQELAFKYAVHEINGRKDFLSKVKLTYDIEQPTRQDSFMASKKVCKQMREGIAAVFGPMSTLSAAHVQSICDAMEIPHVETRWDFSHMNDFFSINLYPHYMALSRAYIDFIDYWEWTSFSILYETDNGLIRLQEILKKYQITVRKLDAPRDDYRQILKELKNKPEYKIILDCDYRNVNKILKQAMGLGMMSQYYHYLVTNLDISLIDLEEFKYGGTNITGFRLVDPTKPQVVKVMDHLTRKTTEDGITPRQPNMATNGIKNTTLSNTLTTETALIYDAVYLFAKAMEQLLQAQNVHTNSLSCNKAKPWDDGSSLLNYLKLTKIEGLTGRVEFDPRGRRSDFELDLVELTNDGIHKLGRWDPNGGINVTKNYTDVIQEVAANLKNTTLVVTTILEDPYMMLKDNPNGELEGNDLFEGYCVDLLEAISEILDLKYTIRQVADKQYGSPEGPKNEWTGMVRELIDRKADLAVASLTISYMREQVIDFTKPFMNLGISILFKKPEKKNPSLFSFLSPLSFEIWIYVLVTYLVVSFMLFVLARFSPYEWYNPHPCNPDSDMVENQFTLLNSLWFTIGSLMQQGSEVAPRAISTRIVSGIWWFFTLIIISSYTANLAAFLTVERMTSPIENADDLSKQTEIKYGTIWGGSTMTFFKSSKIPTYERMWNAMSSAKPSVFVNATKDGIERVQKGNYAYLLESTMNEYVTQRNCELMKVGGMLDSKGYGIGTPRGSPYRDLISNAILKLQEDQTLQMLYNRWWKQKGGAGQCDVLDSKKKDANALSIENVGGVFVVLAAGLVLSLFVAVLEFIWKANKNADQDKKPLCVEMGQGCCFALHCCGSSTKPAKKKHTEFLDKHNEYMGIHDHLTQNHTRQQYA